MDAFNVHCVCCRWKAENKLQTRQVKLFGNIDFERLLSVSIVYQVTASSGINFNLAILKEQNHFCTIK